MKWKKRLSRWLLVIVLIYLLIGACLYFFQDRFLFHPRALPSGHRFSFSQPFEEMNIPFGKTNLNMIRFLPGGRRKGIVLFFHGNRENVEHYKNYPSLFTKNGYEVWMMDYPGFGKTTGPRSESILYEQALLIYRLAGEQVQSDSIIVYGKSIGTGIAAYVAANRTCRQLILETPYYSMKDLARHYFPIYPVGAMIRYSFPVHDYVGQFHKQVTVFHGTDDGVVPYNQSRRLAATFPFVELVTIKKGRHNDLFNFPVYQQKMNDLLR
jgi:uncharacterized protein